MSCPAVKLWCWHIVLGPRCACPPSISKSLAGLCLVGKACLSTQPGDVPVIFSCRCKRHCQKLARLLVRTGRHTLTASASCVSCVVVCMCCRHVGASTDLLPLLQLPADDPRDSSSSAAAPSGGPSSSSSPSITLLGVLRRLEQQARLYRRSAEQLMAEDEDAGDDEETTAAVCLALDLSSLVQSLEEALQLFTTTLQQEAGSLSIKPVPAADTPSQEAAGKGAAGASGKGRKGRTSSKSAATGGGGGPAAAPNPEAAAAAARERCYVAAMQPYRFIEADLLACGYYFAKEAAANAQKAAGGEVMRKRLKRITDELGVLSTSLPLSYDSSILLAVHADRLDVLRALLLPHPDTPYGGGAFLFDILLPPEYPDKPPKVRWC